MSKLLDFIEDNEFRIADTCASCQNVEIFPDAYQCRLMARVQKIYIGDPRCSCGAIGICDKYLYDAYKIEELKLT